MYRNQAEARQLEFGMALGQHRINVVSPEFVKIPGPPKLPMAPKAVPKVKPVEGTKEVVLCVDRPDETVLIGRDLSAEREEELLRFFGTMLMSLLGRRVFFPELTKQWLCTGLM